MIALLITALASSVSFAAAICSNAENSLSTACDAQHEEALDLLQRKSLALQGAHHTLQGELSKSPVTTFKSFTDSQCTTATGEDAIISLKEDACVFGWTFTCSCQGHAKVLIGKKYKSLSCKATEPPEEHVVPFHTCVPAGHSPTFSGNVFMNVTDQGSCPCCGASCGDSSGQESLLVKERERVVKTTRSGPLVGMDLWEIDGCPDPPGPFAHYDMLADGKTPVPEDGGILSCACSDDETKVLRISWPNGMSVDIPDGQCTSFVTPDSTGVVIANLSACPDAGQSTCTVHGDPHITVFDQAEVSLLGVKDNLKHPNAQQAKHVDNIFGWGDFWLVKSEQVHVQGRYRKVYYPKAKFHNNSFLTSVAIGGPFMQGYKLIVEPRTGSVTWADAAGTRKLLGNKELDAMRTEGDADEDFVFEHEKLIKAVYSNSTAIVPKHRQGLVRGLDVELPSKVKLFVDRFAKHLDMRIEMTARAGGAGGVDGQCGNFNGDASDDTVELIEKRFGYPVPKDELLFD